MDRASTASGAALVAITATDSSTLRETIDHILFAPSGLRYLTKIVGCHVKEI